MKGLGEIHELRLELIKHNFVRRILKVEISNEVFSDFLIFLLHEELTD